jgi:hypothetical protein
MFVLMLLGTETWMHYNSLMRMDAPGMKQRVSKQRNMVIWKFCNGLTLTVVLGMKKHVPEQRNLGIWKLSNGLVPKDVLGMKIRFQKPLGVDT